MTKRIVFFGSPDFAVPILDKLNQKYSLSAIVTQPDRPSGRGGKMEFSPVKKSALSLGLQVLQPEKVRETVFIQEMRELNPDLIIVAAYGQILPKTILELPQFDCINVHASLLPRWRGASPIQAAILAGDESTGVSIMVMDEGLDTGPVLSQQKVSIDIEETQLTLSKKLSEVGAGLLVNILDQYFAGQIQPIKQDEKFATKTKLIQKSDGNMDFNQSAVFLERMVRAFYPWPVAFFTWNNFRIKVIRAHPNKQSAKRGEHKIIEKNPAIGTSEGYLILDSLQPEGRKVMTGEEYLNGVRNWVIRN